MGTTSSELARAPAHRTRNMAACKDLSDEVECRVERASQIVWDYHHVGHNVRETQFLAHLDGILVFCSSDVHVADVAARLWVAAASAREAAKQRCTGSDNGEEESASALPFLLFSGGTGTGPHSGANMLGWSDPEAVVLSRRAKEYLGQHSLVPIDKIPLFIEPKSRNSGENVKFSRELLEQHSINPTLLAVVQKPFMERRTYATLKKQWTGPEFRVCSSTVSFEQYISESELAKDDIVGIMLGDLQRVVLYAPPHGQFQIQQEVPDVVFDAFEFLAYNPIVRKRHPRFTINLIDKKIKPELSTHE